MSYSNTGSPRVVAQFELWKLGEYKYGLETRIWLGKKGTDKNKVRQPLANLQGIDTYREYR